jgi:DNA-binding MarR family transcriptional regulator
MQTNSPPLPSLPCMCASLRRASRAITASYDEALRDTGLRVTQFSLLQVIDRAGSLTQGALGESLALDTTTLTRSLRPLVAAGLVKSVPGKDRRERILTLTPKGRATHAGAAKAWKRVQQRWHKELGAPVWARLGDDLQAVTEVGVAAG